MPRWMSSGSMICSPILSTGLSDVIGSWKIMAMSRPRMLRISSSERPSSSRPSKRTMPWDARRAGRQQPHDGQRGHGLARARFADDRHHLAGIDRVAQPLDRPHGAVRGDELNVEVVDLDQGPRAGGSNAPSPAGKRPVPEGRDDLVVQRFLPVAEAGLLLDPSPLPRRTWYASPLLAHKGKAEQERMTLQTTHRSAFRLWRRRSVSGVRDPAATITLREVLHGRQHPVPRRQPSAAGRLRQPAHRRPAGREADAHELSPPTTRPSSKASSTSSSPPPMRTDVPTAPSRAAHRVSCA